jgi:hypothetical protein
MAHRDPPAQDRDVLDRAVSPAPARDRRTKVDLGIDGRTALVTRSDSGVVSGSDYRVDAGSVATL